MTAGCFTTKLSISCISLLKKSNTLCTDTQLWLSLCLFTFPEAALSHMKNLVPLNVSSPCFSHTYFIRYTPLLEELWFTECLLFDIDIFVQQISHTKPQKLQVLDLTGVPNVTSLHMWSITYACDNLRELYAPNRMSSFFGEQIFLNCQKLVIFDCLPLLGKEQEWRKLQSRTDVKFGAKMRAAL